jgi:hypothetical protein
MRGQVHWNSFASKSENCTCSSRYFHLECFKIYDITRLIAMVDYYCLCGLQDAKGQWQIDVCMISWRLGV